MAGWILFQAILHIILPGVRAKGTLLPDGSRLEYTLNGFLCLVVTTLAVTYGACYGYCNMLRNEVLGDFR